MAQLVLETEHVLAVLRQVHQPLQLIGHQFGGLGQRIFDLRRLQVADFVRVPANMDTIPNQVEIKWWAPCLTEEISEKKIKKSV